MQEVSTAALPRLRPPPAAAAPDPTARRRRPSCPPRSTQPASARSASPRDSPRYPRPPPFYVLPFRPSWRSWPWCRPSAIACRAAVPPPAPVTAPPPRSVYQTHYFVWNLATCFFVENSVLSVRSIRAGRHNLGNAGPRRSARPVQLAVNSAAILLLGSGLQTVAFPAGRALGVLAVSLLATSTLTILACAVLFVATDDEDYLCVPPPHLPTALLPHRALASPSSPSPPASPTSAAQLAPPSSSPSASPPTPRTCSCCSSPRSPPGSARQRAPPAPNHFASHTPLASVHSGRPPGNRCPLLHPRPPRLPPHGLPAPRDRLGPSLLLRGPGLPGARRPRCRVPLHQPHQPDRVRGSPSPLSCACLR